MFSIKEGTCIGKNCFIVIRTRGTESINEEKNWLYDHAQYVLAPSRYEGFGLPVFEAFVAGKPLFGTDIPVYLEFLKHEENAMISKTGNAQELAQNIKILDNNPALAKQLVSAGYKTAEKFSDKVMIDKFVKVIEALVNET